LPSQKETLNHARQDYIQSRKKLNFQGAGLIKDAIYVQGNSVFIDSEKVQSFQGLQIDYSGDISIGCSWATSFFDFTIMDNEVNRKTDWILCANNQSGVALFFGVSRDPSKRIMDISNLPNGGELFTFNEINGSFTINNALAGLGDFSSRLGIRRDRTNTFKFGGLHDRWTNTKENWGDLGDGIVNVDNSNKIKSRLTGFEVNSFKRNITKEQAIRRSLTNKRMNKNKPNIGRINTGKNNIKRNKNGYNK
tara:strand:- start:336 stop:1085 length:750 start_codon:yes stop_codon:yes gene_type:complete